MDVSWPRSRASSKVALRVPPGSNSPPSFRTTRILRERLRSASTWSGYIVGASDWLRSIWQNRAAFAETPALILRDLKDIAFRRKELGRSKSALRDVEVQEFEDCGHFVAEEAPGRVAEVIRGFMGGPGSVLSATIRTWK